MINKKSLQAVESSRFSSSFVKPLYGSYCFSRIPHTIESILSDVSPLSLPDDVLPEKKKYQKVVFLFVDAFGWKFFEEYKDKYPSLQRFFDNGIVSKLTSQFPSTTSVHVTTINTGLNVGEHGVYEWFYYEPKLNDIIAPLLFSFARDHERDTLKSVGADPADLYPNQTLYEKLHIHGVKSYVFPSSEFAQSPYNIQMNKGSTQSIPYHTVSEAFTLLSKKLLDTKDKAYFFFYYGKIDAMGHEYGPDSVEFKAEIDTYFTALERLFFAMIDKELEDTLILLSADHGQTRVFPGKTIYINKLITDIEKYFLRTKTGKPIVPAGSCRDMFLHVQEDKVDDLQKLLGEKLDGRAEVYKTEQLMNEGFFGENEPSPEFLSRVGNLVILPFSQEGVWWYEEGIFEQVLNGHHGGLTKEEMEIPLLSI